MPFHLRSMTQQQAAELSCPVRCSGCVERNRSMTEKARVMRASGYIGRFGPRKVYLFGVTIIGLVWVLYFVRPGEDRVSARASHLTEGQVGELNPAEEKSQFVDLKGPVVAILEPPKKNGVVSSLRSLIGIGIDDKTPAKSEIPLDAHAERALEVLELNLGHNSTLHHAVGAVGKKVTSEKIRLVPPDDLIISGDDLPRCAYNKSRDRMSNFFGESYDAKLSPFLSKDYNNIPDILSYPLPFGLQNSERVLNKDLAVVNRTGFNATRGKRCSRCVVVGSGGILWKTSLGKTIDEHDVVIRMNDAPIAGFEEDVGARTTLRLAYPESSFQNRDLYLDHWLYVAVLFKPSDGEWLFDVASGKTVRSSLHFWKSVATSLPKPADEFRIFNPLILRELATMIGFNISSGKMNKNVPTTGSIAISLATRLCDEVSVAGFGYTEDKPLHYYDKFKASNVKKSWTHNIVKEKQWLEKLVVQGVIQDLTGGIVQR